MFDPNRMAESFIMAVESCLSYIIFDKFCNKSFVIRDISEWFFLWCRQFKLDFIHLHQLTDLDFLFDKSAESIIFIDNFARFNLLFVRSPFLNTIFWDPNTINLIRWHIDRTAAWFGVNKLRCLWFGLYTNTCPTLCRHGHLCIVFIVWGFPWVYWLRSKRRIVSWSHRCQWKLFDSHTARFKLPLNSANHAELGTDADTFCSVVEWQGFKAFLIVIRLILECWEETSVEDGLAWQTLLNVRHDDRLLLL